MSENNKDSAAVTYNAPKPKIANLRETERTLQSARRARRRAFSELCRLRREYRDSGESTKEITSKIEILRHFINLEGRGE